MRRSRLFSGVVVLASLMSGGIATSSEAAPRENRQELNDVQKAGLIKLELEIAAQLRAAPGGRRASLNSVSWRNDSVIMRLPLPRGLEYLDGAAVGVDPAVRPSAVRPLAGDTLYKYGCPYGTRVNWFCFYENPNFNGVQLKNSGPGNGRLLQFKDQGLQDLASWNFRDKTSSWVNNKSSRVIVYNIPAGKDCSTAAELWREGGNSALGDVGSTKNERADCFRH